MGGTAEADPVANSAQFSIPKHSRTCGPIDRVQGQMEPVQSVSTSWLQALALLLALTLLELDEF